MYTVSEYFDRVAHKPTEKVNCMAAAAYNTVSEGIPSPVTGFKELCGFESIFGLSRDNYLCSHDLDDIVIIAELTENGLAFGC